MVEALGGVPRLALVPGGGLQVAAGQVDADRIAEHQRQRRVRRHVRPAASQGDDELDLVVQIVRRRRIGNRGAGRGDGVGGLGEEERRIAVVAAHLPPMGGVVATDAQNAPHGKQGVRSHDGDGRDGRGAKQ